MFRVEQNLKCFSFIIFYIFGLHADITKSRLVIVAVFNVKESSIYSIFEILIVNIGKQVVNTNIKVLPVDSEGCKLWGPVIAFLITNERVFRINQTLALWAYPG
jgi:hypothetical protein